jgi:hypothetical protein
MSELALRIPDRDMPFMSTTPPTISPRLRSRESSAAPSSSTSASSPIAGPSKLRVLIRLPHVVPESNVSARFKFAVGLLATLKRSYAAAAFAVFLVGIVIMLLHGKSPAPSQNDSESDSPRWNSAITAPAAQQAPSGPMIHSGDVQSRTVAPMARSAAPQTPVDVARRPAAASPVTAAAVDQIPYMPRSNPSIEGMASRGPPWRGPTPTPTSGPAAPTYR